MKKLLLILFITGCGLRPLIPEKIKIDAPEEIIIKHEISWEFVEEYCTNFATTNNELEECVNGFIKKFKIPVNV